MKTFLKLTFIAFIVIIAGVIGITTYQFNTYKPRAVTEKANSNNLKYFQESYNDCRNSFLAEAKIVSAAVPPPNDIFRITSFDST